MHDMWQVYKFNLKAQVKITKITGSMTQDFRFVSQKFLPVNHTCISLFFALRNLLCAKKVSIFPNWKK